MNNPLHDLVRLKTSKELHDFERWYNHRKRQREISLENLPVSATRPWRDDLLRLRLELAWQIYYIIYRTKKRDHIRLLLAARAFKNLRAGHKLSMGWLHRWVHPRTTSSAISPNYLEDSEFRRRRSAACGHVRSVVLSSEFDYQETRPAPDEPEPTFF